MAITNLSQVQHIKDIFTEQVGDHELLQPAWVTEEGGVHIAAPADISVMDKSLINALIANVHRDAQLWMITPEDMETFLQRLPEDQRDDLLDLMHRGRFEPMSWKQRGGAGEQMRSAYYIFRFEERNEDGSLEGVRYYPLSQVLTPTERCEMAAYSCDLLNRLEEGGAGPVVSSNSGLPPLQDRIDSATVKHAILNDGREADVIDIQIIPQEFVQMYELGYHQVYLEDGTKYWEKVPAAVTE